MAEVPGLMVACSPMIRRKLALGPQAEWWVAVGDQQERVGGDAVVPADHALDEVE
jgi:hypothetical protein